MIGQAPPKLKGKMARMVATKAALSIRVDALTEADGKSEENAALIGIENRAKLESRLRALEYQLEGGAVRRFGDSGRKSQGKFEGAAGAGVYNAKTDDVDLVSTQRDATAVDIAMKIVDETKEEKKKAKEDKKKKKEKKDKDEGSGHKRKRDEDVVMEDATADAEETEEQKKARKAAKKAAKKEKAVSEESPKKKKKKTSDE